MNIIIAVLSLLHLIASQLAFCPNSINKVIELGLKNTICIKIVAGNFSQNYQYGVVADKLTIISLKNIGIFSNRSEKVYLHAQFQNNNIAYTKILYDPSLPAYRNLLSLVIQGSNGLFNSMVSESQDCSACTLTTNICYQLECFKRGELSDQDRILVYISWIGTDINGQHMMSYTQRLKPLQKFSLNNIYSEAFKIY